MSKTIFMLFLLLSVPAFAETLEEKRTRCFKDCTKHNPDIDKMGECFMDEVNCIYPEENPAFNEVREQEDALESD